MKLLLSAGHNEQAQGAVNGEGFTEWVIATQWVNLIQELIDPIIPCAIVPSGTLNSKVKWINQQPDVLVVVEIHFNSNVNAKGVEALYHPNSKAGARLAKHLTDGFEKRNLFMPNRGPKEGYYQMNPDKPVDFLLRKTNPIACIFEPDFISQKNRIIANKDIACNAIADILIDYVDSEFGV